MGRELDLKVRAVDEASGALRDIRNQVEGLGQSAQSASSDGLSRLSGQIEDLGRTASDTASGPLDDLRQGVDALSAASSGSSGASGAAGAAGAVGAAAGASGALASLGAALGVVSLVAMAASQAVDMVADSVRNAVGAAQWFVAGVLNPVVEYSRQVQELSAATGQSTEETGRLIHMSARMGIEVQTLEASFRAMVKRGAVPSVEAMASLSDRFLAIEDPLKRAEFLVRHFGQAGLDMAPMMQMGGEAIREQAEAVSEHALMSDEAHEALGRWELALGTLDEAMLGAKAVLVEELLPYIEIFAGFIETHARPAVYGFSKVTSDLVRNLRNLAGALRDLLPDKDFLIWLVETAMRIVGPSPLQGLQSFIEGNRATPGGPGKGLGSGTGEPIGGPYGSPSSALPPGAVPADLDWWGNQAYWAPGVGYISGNGEPLDLTTRGGGTVETVPNAGIPSPWIPPYSIPGYHYDSAGPLPGRAGGGQLSLGRWTMVGERGPELVSPSGQVIPAGQTSDMQGTSSAMLLKEIRGLRGDMSRLGHTLPIAIRDAMLEARS